MMVETLDAIGSSNFVLTQNGRKCCFCYKLLPVFIRKNYSFVEVGNQEQGYGMPLKLILQVHQNNHILLTNFYILRKNQKIIY